MPSEMHWHQYKRVLIVRFHGDLAAEDTVADGKAIDAMATTGEKPVHLVMDISDMRKFPTNISLLKHSAPFIHNPSIGWIVAVGGSSLAATFVQILGRVTNAHYRVFSTRDEALAFLCEQDPSLKESDPAR